MKKLFYLFLTFIFFHTISIDAQNSKQSGPTLQPEESIDKKLKDIATTPDIDPKLMETQLLQLKAESGKLNYDWGVLQSGDYLMDLYLKQSRNKEALELGNQLKKVAANKKDTYGFISNIYRRNALALGYLGLSDVSLKDFKTAISYAETIADTDKKLYLLALCYENMTIYYINKRFENKTSKDSVVYYLNKSLETAKQIRDNNKTIPKYDQISFIDMRLGIFYLEQANVKGNIDSAEKHLLEGLKIHENKEYNIPPDNKIMMLNQVSWLYMEKKEHKKSIDFAKRALELEKQFNDPYHRVESFEFLANSYLETGEKEKSKFYMEKYTFLKDSLSYADKSNADTTMKEMVAEVSDNHKKNTEKQLIFISIFVLIAATGIWILWRRKNRVTHRKYEQMIEKLKNEALKNSEETDKNELPVSYNRNNIADETERKLLKKLEAFENSEKFLRKDLTISFLSNQWNTNPKYLSEIIKNNKAQNFSNYINTLRIDYIVHKLYNDPKYRQYKISYLAEECGYASRQVFVFAFKKINGVTPSYFIQNLKNESV
ncbi:AraC-like DNA-binding protein [Chryseobacterium defluvii]|uniref:AraC-like DNA-binding protein n=1 Tax=Chryseobacterium defluvii TaxID=160396 RepID=A0A840KH93_9FLAO|nr:helix-turn-helix domain-containing protein [Chryseobacterium defluvii]MBB4807388.1 AraC-like DNA-binding protein [Chryseobacterium defluvii]